MVKRNTIGLLSNGDWGIDISLPGVDVDSASLNQMAFSSRWANGCVIHQTGIVTSVFDDGGKTVSFPALPYVPMVYLVARRDDNGTIRSSVQYMNLNYNDLRFMFHPFCRVTASSLFFDAQQNGRLPGINYDCRYVVFKTPGA